MPREIGVAREGQGPEMGEPVRLGVRVAVALGLDEACLRLVRASGKQLRSNAGELRDALTAFLAGERGSSASDLSGGGCAAVLAGQFADQVLALLDGDIGLQRTAEVLALGRDCYRRGIPHACIGALHLVALEQLESCVDTMGLSPAKAAHLRRALQRLVWWSRELQLFHYDSRRRLQACLAAQREIAEILSRETPAPELLDAVCRVAVERTDLSLAWVGRPVPRDGPVEILAAAGEAVAYLTSMQRSADHGGTGARGPLARCVSGNAMVVMDDLEGDEDFLPWRDWAMRFGLRSAAAFPMHEDGEISAVLMVYASEANYFDGELCALFEEIARDVSYALTDSRRRSGLAHVRKFYAAVSEINQAIARLPPQEELLGEVARTLATRIGASLVYFCDVSVADATRCISHAAGPAQASAHTVNEALEHYLPSGVCERAVANSGPVVINSLSTAVGTEEGRTVFETHGLGAVAALSLPGSGDGQTRVLVLAMAEEDAFGEDVVQLLGQLSNELGFGLAGVERRERLTRLQGYYAALAEINGLVARAPEVDELLHHACELVVHHAGATLTYIAIVDAETETVRIAASEGPASGFVTSIQIAVGADEPGGRGMVGQVYRGNTEIIANDLSNDPRFAHMRQGLARWHLGSGAGFPVHVDGETRAVLTVAASRVDHFAPELAGLVGRMAEAIGLGLARAQEREAARGYEALYSALANLNELIAHDPEPMMLYAEACRVVARVSPELSAYVATVARDSGHAHVVACSGVTEEVAADLRSVVLRVDPGEPSGHGIVGTTYRARRTVVWEQVPERAEDESKTDLVRRVGVKSMVGIPIIRGEQCVGVLVLAARQRAYFNAELVRLSERMGDNIGFALHAHQQRLVLEQQALTDALTDLPNRSLYEDRLRVALSRALREGHQVVVVLIDLDGFKEINDRLGHTVGDRVLRSTARRILGSLRKSDTLARFGGDELVAVLSMNDAASHVGEVLDRILAAIRAPLEMGEEQLLVRASLGVAIYPHDAETPDDLLRRADLAMYRVKQRGGDGWGLFETELEERMLRRHEVRQSLSQALARGEFELYYQPLVTLHNGRISGLEALIRWHNPELGLVMPSEFIPVAEETGLILEMGEWVLTEACREIHRLHDMGFPKVRVAVNLSARQFRQPELAERVASVLAATGVSAETLTLEITETTVMERVEATRKTLAALHEQGVRIALDDFGTGYSSLSYLKHFPIDWLKVDQSFIGGAPADESSTAIVRTIIAMALSLGIGVLAEGIETIEQLAALREWGCQEGQGYLLSRPLARSEMESLLRSGVSLPAGGEADGEVGEEGQERILH